MVHLCSHPGINIMLDVLILYIMHSFRMYFHSNMDSNIGRLYTIDRLDNLNCFGNQKYKLHLGIIDLLDNFLDYICFDIFQPHKFDHTNIGHQLNSFPYNIHLIHHIGIVYCIVAMVMNN